MSFTEQIKRFILIAVVYITSAFFLVNSMKLQDDAGTFPKFMAGLLMFLNTVYLIDVLRGKDAPKKKKEEIVQKRLVGAVFISIVYVAGLNFLGFLITSLVCIPAMMVILGVKSKKTIAIMTVVSVALLWLFFGLFLNVPLPEGILQM